jgi:hypothetical protein
MRKARHEEEKIVVFGKPKGMSVEEWQAHQSRERQAKDAAKAEKLAKLPKKEKKAAPPAGSFTLRQLARDNSIDPRDARRVARANKDKLKVLEVAGKYVYDDKSRSDVLKIIKDGLTGEKAKKGKATTGKKAKLKLPPPGETVWTGKAKVKRTKGPAPEPVSKKKDDRKTAKASAKGRKRIKVEGGAMLIKRRK